MKVHRVFDVENKTAWTIIYNIETRKLVCDLPTDITTILYTGRCLLYIYKSVVKFRIACRWAF